MPQVAGFVVGAFGFGAGSFAIGSAAFGGWAAGAAFASTALGGLAVNLLTTVSLSALQIALNKPRPSGGGITVSATLRGEQNPETIILGRTATAGQAICPPMSHGPANYYLTHVVELCSAPGATLDRLILGDEYVEIGETEHPDYGRPVLGDYEHFVWIKYYDGSQTAADPMLLDKYGDDPDRPWTSDMVGEGLCYAILTFKHHSSILPQVPTYRFEMTGIPVYDIRKDSSAGGLGSQRWHDPATWEQSLNPIVNLWNIWRGIRLPGGEIWGGDVSATALPSGNWISQMNKCDQLVALSEGDPEPRYRFGIEAALTEEPNAIAEELLKSASADIADMGGYWRVLVAEPDLPVYTFNDDDILVSSEQEYDPFPTIGETYNGVTASYPDPESLYEAKDAPGRYNADWEARDAFGRRTADLNLPAVPFGNQVQRLMQGWIDDERRFRRHVFSLPPDSAAVELLDTVGYTSARNGYDDKDFTVREITENLLTGIRKVSLREQDPADYLWSTDLELPDPPAPIGTSRVAVLVPGFDVQAVSIIGDDGAPRRPALRILWDPEVMADGVRWQIRLKDQPSEIVTGASLDIEAGNATVSDTILAATTYQVQCRLVSRQLSDWTAWIDVTTPDIRLRARDLDDTINDAITGANERANDAFDLHFVELPEADGTLGEMRDAVFGEDGVLTPVPLVPLLTQAYGPLFAPLPMIDRVKLAYGPLDVEVSVSDRLDIAVARLDFEIPQIRSASGSVDELFELLIGLQGQVGDVQRTMARAGIRVLEDQGRVEIAALAAANARLGEVGLTLDAMSGQISQRATVAYVNEAISNAVLDPTQIPVISDISLRLGSVETTLDAETGRIDHLASLFVVEGAEMSLVAVSSRLDAAEEALTQRVTSEDFDAEVERLNGVEQTLTTLGDVSELRQTVTATRGLLSDQDALGEATIADLWANHLGRSTLRKAEAAGRRSLRAFVDENFAAEVQARDELSVQIGAAEARIVQEGQLRAEEALATGEILSQMQIDLENQDQTLQGTIETLDETTGRVEQTEEGLEAEAKRTDFLGAAIRIQGSDAEDASELSLAGMWDAVKTRADQRRQLAVSMRAINARVDEGLLAEATERAVLGVALDGAFASIAEEKVVRAEQDRVLGEQASQITARLGATEAAIVELNRVELGSTSALVQSLLKLSGDVEDPDTGLAQAHGEITELNTVNLGSTSALVQAHLEVAGKVLDPETGVEANARALETVTSSVEGQGEDLEALVQRADVLEAAVRSGQILPNGDFAEGDLRGWEDIPATFLVRNRQAGGPAALADAPTPYVLEMAQHAASQRAAAIKHVPVRTDETFRASLVGAASASGSALITLRFAFYGADGAYLSAVERNISLSGHAWAPHQPADIQTPAGAQSAWIWLRRNAGGTGNVYVADLRVERFTSGQTEALAKIEELNTVNASSDAALVQAHLSLAGTVNDPETGLARAHGLITDLNTV
ncbi:MAG: hypothetical protein MRY77_14555, partial [Rhodobacteraceae bacterium]|nr:hypothetical protein [Paracoccaceae bacterium]